MSLPAVGFAAASVAPFGWPFGPPTIDREQELDVLKRQAEYLSNTLEGIRKRIEELETQPQGD